MGSLPRTVRDREDCSNVVFSGGSRVEGGPHSALANLIFFLPLRLRLEKFESLRVGLKKYRLIKNGPTGGSRRCGGEWGRDGCMVCLATHVCAKLVTNLRIKPVIDIQIYRFAHCCLGLCLIRSLFIFTIVVFMT